LTVRTEPLAWAKDCAGVCSRQMILNRTQTRSGIAFTLAAPYAATPHGRSTICMPPIQPAPPPLLYRPRCARITEPGRSRRARAGPRPRGSCRGRGRSGPGLVADQPVRGDAAPALEGLDE